MNGNRKDKSMKRLLYVVPLILLAVLIVLRFLVLYFTTDGLSGMSIIIPLLMVGSIVFALLTSTCFSAWVYQDCKKRNEDRILWPVIVFVATPFIGMLVYFLRRADIKDRCRSCGHPVSLKANYCEECGSRMEPKEEKEIMEMQKTHHIHYIITGVICLALMLVFLTGFVASAASGRYMNTTVTSNEKVWNLGAARMNYDTYIHGTWKLDLKSASDGFVAQEDMDIVNAKTNILHADVSCGTVPEGAALTLWLVQGEVVRSVDVTNLSEPVEYALTEFENGKLHVRLEINGVRDVVSEIYIQ